MVHFRSILANDEADVNDIAGPMLEYRFKQLPSYIIGTYMF